MRLFLYTVLAALLFVPSVMAQAEQGDREVQFAGSIYAAESFTMINLTGVYGYYIRDYIEIGGGPMITHMEAYGFDNTTIGGVFFGRYYFSTVSRSVPYLSGQWYQYDFAPDDPMSFFDASNLQVGGGIKYFINEYIAWDASANLGINLGGGDVVLLIIGGLSAFF